MTDREIQIGEMEAIIIRSHCDNPLSKDCYGECEYCMAKDLYDAGYHKPSEGEWAYNEDYECFVCSVCGHSALNNYRGLSVNSNFCPCCGAKMKGSNDDERRTD